MSIFRKKPVVVEAIQWTGKNFQELYAWGRPADVKLEAQIIWSIDAKKKSLAIKTLEGWVIASVGDWIVRGAQGEFYPCKPDIFEANHENVS